MAAKKAKKPPSTKKQELKKSQAEKEDEEDDEKIKLPDGSDDEEEEEPEAPKKAPHKTKANRFQKMEEQADSEPRGVVYLGHIPNGFFEPQMRTFFTQFGEITRMRLSRSKKSARSRGYAFLEFKEESVAKIVAETMNKYLLFEKQLVCHLVPPEKQHPQIFKNWKKRIPNFTNQRRRKERTTFNDRPKVEVDGEEVPQVTQRQVVRRNNKENKLQSMLKDLGIDFDVNEASQGQPRLRSKGPKANLLGTASATTAATALSKSQEVATTSKKRKQPLEGAAEETVEKKSSKQSLKASPNASPKASPKAMPKVTPKPKRAVVKKKAK